MTNVQTPEQIQQLIETAEAHYNSLAVDVEASTTAWEQACAQGRDTEADELEDTLDGLKRQQRRYELRLDALHRELEEAEGRQRLKRIEAINGELTGMAQTFKERVVKLEKARQKLVDDMSQAIQASLSAQEKVRELMALAPEAVDAEQQIREVFGELNFDAGGMDYQNMSFTARRLREHAEGVNRLAASVRSNTITKRIAAQAEAHRQQRAAG